LPEDQVAMQGKLRFGRVTYGIEEIYIPEDQRAQINMAVDEANRKQKGTIEVKVGRSGQAVPQTLWIGSTRLRF
jgi:uncharacterized membrane-anchored protein